MTTGSTVTKRRTLLQRGAALLAGGVALAGGTRLAGAAPPPATSPPRTLTMYARSTPAAHAHGDGRIVASGELFDAPDGERIGSFHTNCFCATTQFGQPAQSASNLEFHVLQLKTGTLFGIGSGAEAASGQPMAIVGGTAAFAGRSGTVVQEVIAGTISADLRQITITFAS
jgi:hypothetical protein